MLTQKLDRSGFLAIGQSHGRLAPSAEIRIAQASEQRLTDRWGILLGDRNREGGPFANLRLRILHELEQCLQARANHRKVAQVGDRKRPGDSPADVLQRVLGQGDQPSCRVGQLPKVDRADQGGDDLRVLLVGDHRKDHRLGLSRIGFGVFAELS